MREVYALYSRVEEAGILYSSVIYRERVLYKFDMGKIVEVCHVVDGGI